MLAGLWLLFWIVIVQDVFVSQIFDVCGIFSNPGPVCLPALIHNEPDT